MIWLIDKYNKSILRLSLIGTIMTNILIDISIKIMYTYIPDTLRYVNIYTAWVSISSKDRLRRWLLSRPAAANGCKQRCNANQFSPFIYCMYLKKIYIYIFTICRFNLKTFAWEIGYIQLISNIIKNMIIIHVNTSLGCSLYDLMTCENIYCPN